MTSEIIAIIAVIFAGLTFVTSMVEKIFGGSAKLAQRFHELQMQTVNGFQSIRDDFNVRVGSAQDNSRVGFEAISANIHAMQLSHAEFRAKMSEEFIRWRDFNDIRAELKREFNDKHNDLKTDMHEGFEKLERSIEAVSMSIESARKESKSVT